MYTEAFLANALGRLDKCRSFTCFHTWYCGVTVGFVLVLRVYGTVSERDIAARYYNLDCHFMMYTSSQLDHRFQGLRTGGRESLESAVAA